MCTALTLQSKQKESFFGRTMDFSYPIEPELYVAPRNYQWNSLVTNKRYVNSNSFIGIGQETDGMGIASSDGNKIPE
ncbi:linear amide C-N hydrolase [Amphibacillus indicireducens]|uniref:Choloylglycine hydrolase/NAAA C-terminal domain-containing protein n=1 Tax=Amphibacillus indicireducens TaxID=1076330 RepID=A0ABP7V825_9BACI